MCVSGLAEKQNENKKPQLNKETSMQSNKKGPLLARTCKLAVTLVTRLVTRLLVIYMKKD